MQTAPVYSAPPTTYGAPTMFPTYMAPGTMPVTYAAPTYAAPQPVQTVTGPVMTTLAASWLRGGIPLITPPYIYMHILVSKGGHWI